MIYLFFLLMVFGSGFFVPAYDLNQTCFHCKTLLTENDKIVLSNGFPSISTGMVTVSNVSDGITDFQIQTNELWDNFGNVISCYENILNINRNGRTYSVDTNTFELTIYNQSVYPVNKKYLMSRSGTNLTVYNISNEELLLDIEICDYGLQVSYLGTFLNENYLLLQTAVRFSYYVQEYQLVFVNWKTGHFGRLFLEKAAYMYDLTIDSLNNVYIFYIDGSNKYWMEKHALFTCDDSSMSKIFHPVNTPNDNTKNVGKSENTPTYKNNNVAYSTHEDNNTPTIGSTRKNDNAENAPKDGGQSESRGGTCDTGCENSTLKFRIEMEALTRFDRQYNVGKKPVETIVTCKANRCRGYDSEGQYLYQFEMEFNITQLSVAGTYAFVANKQQITIFHHGIKMQSIYYDNVNLLDINTHYLSFTSGTQFKPVHVYYQEMDDDDDENSTSSSTPLSSLF